MHNDPLVFEYHDYPLIPIKFHAGDRVTPLIDALLDSGGDFIVIPNAIAKFLKLKLSKASCVDTAGGETTLSSAHVTMTIHGDNRQYSYSNIEIFVSDRSDLPVLLGRRPVFDDHEIVFKKHENTLILQSIHPETTK